MTEADAIQALLDLADPERSENAEQSGRLVVLGLAVRQGRRVRPSKAGWFLMGEAGRQFGLESDRVAF